MSSLNDRLWLPFQLSSIGHIQSGQDIYATERTTGSIPYITSGSQKNGIGFFVGNMNETFDKDYIAINRNGAVGLAFYHSYWSLMGNDCRKLHLDEADGNLYIGIFISAAITRQSKSFSYSRKLGTGRANKLKIMLPAIDKDTPDYAFMENYIRNLISKRKRYYIDYIKRKLSEYSNESNDNNSTDWKSSLNSCKWLPFYVVDIFPENRRGKRLTKANQKPGMVPYASSTGVNNGIDAFIEATKDTRVFSNCISLANSGSVGSAFFEPFEFVASDHITHLKRNGLNQWQYLFLTCLLEKQASNFNFNREISDDRLKKMKIMVPVNDSGSPDYEIMEKIGKKLMFAKYMQYLEFLEKN